MAEWPYASAAEIRHVTDGFPLPSQQRLGIEIIQERSQEDPLVY